MTIEDKKYNRVIRSFVKREGKFTKGQQNAIDELWGSMGVQLTNSELNFKQVFGDDNPVILEIGFGNGLSVATMAEAALDTNFFGIEVHRPGVGSLLVQVKKRDLKNIRVSMDDAVEVIRQQIPDGSLERIQIFFPDPWHKKRHHKRRLIQPVFVNQLVSKLKSNGTLHVATDWENYAEHILEVLEAEPALNNAASGSSAYVEKPEYRPLTKFENRGIKLGHGVWDLVFVKSEFEKRA